MPALMAYNAEYERSWSALSTALAVAGRPAPGGWYLAEFAWPGV